MFEIVKDPMRLKAVSQDVSSVEEAKETISVLENVLKQISNGYGLAAIQLGIAKRVAIIKRDAGFGKGEFISLINPEIIEQSDEFTFREGCLSFPDVFIQNKRYKQVTIKNQVIDEDSFREEIQCYYYDTDKPENLEAIALQHELDHFQGRIIVDNLGIATASTANLKESLKNVGRNDPCPCGAMDDTGKPKKFKKCCGKILSI